MEVTTLLLRHPGHSVNMVLKAPNSTLPTVAKMFHIDATMTEIKMTPLTIAVLAEKSDEIVQLLLAHPHMDVNFPAIFVPPSITRPYKYYESHSPIALARHCRYPAAIRLLEEYSARTGIDELANPEGDKIAAKRRALFVPAMVCIALLLLGFVVFVLACQRNTQKVM